MDKHQEQLSLLGQRLGLPLRFDDKRQCLLMLDEHLLVSIYATHEETWVLHGFLTEISPDHSGHIWSAWMAINLELAKQHAGRLVYEPESQALLYLDELTALHHPNDIFEQLESFINRLETLKEDAITQGAHATGYQPSQSMSERHHHLFK